MAIECSQFEANPWGTMKYRSISDVFSTMCYLDEVLLAYLVSI